DPLLLQALQLVFESDLLRRSQAQRRVMEFEARFAWRHPEQGCARYGQFVGVRCLRWGYREDRLGLLAFDQDVIDEHGRGPCIEGDLVGIDYCQAVDGGKPEPAIARLATCRLAAAAALQAGQPVGARVAEAAESASLP